MKLKAFCIVHTHNVSEDTTVYAKNEKEAEQSARHFLNHVYEERAAGMVFASAEPQSCILMGNHGDEQYFSLPDDDE